MDFETVFKLLISNFKKARIKFAIIGGFALHAAGYSRFTKDIDFIVVKEDMPKVKALLLSLGYEVLHESADVSNFASRLTALGKVDFLHAHRKYARAILENAKEMTIMGGKLKVRVIRPEDIIGLKVQASSNDPARYHKDMADIEEILKVNIGKLDLKILEEYFNLFDRGEELKKILERIRNA